MAAKLLSAVVDAKTSADGLTDPAGGHPAYRALEPRDQALVRAILTTALRFRGSLTAAIDACLDRPLPPNAAPLRHLLAVGATQILHLDVPDSAAVDLAVAAASGDPRSARFAGLVNAVLRRLSREADDVRTRFADPMLDCAPWLAARLSAQYGPERAQAIAAIHRLPAPIDLSVKQDPAGWAERLGGQVVAGATVRLAAGSLSGPVTALPGFEEGDWWVQDAAAALPARLFGDVAGKRIADLCAAPGGKTAQLAAAGAKVTAVDISASRMKRLKANLQRLKLEVDTHIGDLSGLEPPAGGFDGVLLDAPCSSTGTIRRHPDVAYTKDAAEVAKLAAVQQRLLSVAAGLVASGGLLVFSNCSLDREEGEDVARAFLAEHPDFSIEPVLAGELPELAEAITAEGYLRTRPDMLPADDAAAAGLDGFFAARLRKG